MDKLLHAERLDRKAKRTHRLGIDTLPDGAMIALEGEALAVRGESLLPWTPRGYGHAKARPRGIDIDVLTPPSILAVLKAGYLPPWHPSAAQIVDSSTRGQRPLVERGGHQPADKARCIGRK
jgi:hypothetical protein